MPFEMQEPFCKKSSIEKEIRLKKEVETGTFENAAHYLSLRVTNKVGEVNDKKIKLLSKEDIKIN